MQIGILIQNMSKSYVIFHAMATSPKLIFTLITKNRPLLVLMHFHTISSSDLPHSHDLWWENGFTPSQYHTSVQYRYSLKNLLSSDIFIRLHIFFSSTEYAWLKSDTLLQSLMYRERANGPVQLIVKINCSTLWTNQKSKRLALYTWSFVFDNCLSSV